MAAGMVQDQSITLYERHWSVEGEPWAKVQLVHGIAEHIGRYERTAGLLAAAGLDVYGFDLRGHGQTTGRRVYVDRWDDFLDDVQRALHRLRSAGDGLPVAMFGHSMGGLIALTYALSQRRPQPDLLVLSSPALDSNVPATQQALARVTSRVAPKHVFENPFDGSALSHDPAVGEAYFADPFVQPRSTARLAAEMFGTMRRARKDLGRLRVPALVIHGGDDRLVPPRVSEPLGTVPGVERRVFPGLRHETLNGPEGPEVVAQIVAWLQAHVPERPAGC